MAKRSNSVTSTYNIVPAVLDGVHEVAHDGIIKVLDVLITGHSIAESRAQTKKVAFSVLITSAKRYHIGRINFALSA